MHFIRIARLLVFLPLVYVVPGPVASAESPPDPAPSEAAPSIPVALESPRATMETFLNAMRGVRDGQDGAMARAISTLDLADVNLLIRNEKGAEIAWMLQEVLDLTRPPNTRRFSTRKEGKPYVFQTYDEGEVAIAFTESAGWRFSRETVAALPTILDALLRKQQAEGTEQDTAHLPLHLRLRANIPGELRKTSLVLEHWQWAGLLVIIIAGMIFDRVVASVLRVIVRFWRTKFAEGSFREIDDAILRPLGLMAMALVWWAGISVLGLPAGVLVVLLVSVKFLACLSAVWSAYRLVDVVSAFLQDKALSTESKLDDALVPMVTKSIKVFVTIIGAVFIADNLDVDVTSLLAGLGLGGLAFALAAKDVAGNLFGSITVLLDQTFHVGDWVIIGDVEGTVERIGFRSTRIRTFYNSLVSVPNSALITSAVDNMGARRYRRLSCKFGIAYDTPPERIEAFCEGVREFVRQHPYMRKDNYHVYLNGLGDSTLEVLVYVFWDTPDWGTELRERHRFLLDCLRLARRLGVEYAFPTRTLHMRPEEDTPPPPAEGEFAPVLREHEALARGRAEAQAIVGATLGLGVVPPPVAASDSGDDGE